jgi:hypothetical protein
MSSTAAAAAPAPIALAVPVPSSAAQQEASPGRTAPPQTTTDRACPPVPVSEVITTQTTTTTTTTTTSSGGICWPSMRAAATAPSTMAFPSPSTEDRSPPAPFYPLDSLEDSDAAAWTSSPVTVMTPHPHHPRSIISPPLATTTTPAAVPPPEESDNSASSSSPSFLRVTPADLAALPLPSYLNNQKLTLSEYAKLFDINPEDKHNPLFWVLSILYGKYVFGNSKYNVVQTHPSIFQLFFTPRLDLTKAEVEKELWPRYVKYLSDLNLAEQDRLKKFSEARRRIFIDTSDNQVTCWGLLAILRRGEHSSSPKARDMVSLFEYLVKKHEFQSNFDVTKFPLQSCRLSVPQEIKEAYKVIEHPKQKKRIEYVTQKRSNNPPKIVPSASRTTTTTTPTNNKKKKDAAVLPQELPPRSSSLTVVDFSSSSLPRPALVSSDPSLLSPPPPHSTSPVVVEEVTIVDDNETEQQQPPAASVSVASPVSFSSPPPPSSPPNGRLLPRVMTIAEVESKEPFGYQKIDVGSVTSDQLYALNFVMQEKLARIYKLFVDHPERYCPYRFVHDLRALRMKKIEPALPTHLRQRHFMFEDKYGSAAPGDHEQQVMKKNGDFYLTATGFLAFVLKPFNSGYDRAAREAYKSKAEVLIQHYKRLFGVLAPTKRIFGAPSSSELAIARRQAPLHGHLGLNPTTTPISKTKKSVVAVVHKDSDPLTMDSLVDRMLYPERYDHNEEEEEDEEEEEEEEDENASLLRRRRRLRKVAIEEEDAIEESRDDDDDGHHANNNNDCSTSDDAQMVTEGEEIRAGGTPDRSIVSYRCWVSPTPANELRAECDQATISVETIEALLDNLAIYCEEQEALGDRFPIKIWDDFLRKIGYNTTSRHIANQLDSGNPPRWTQSLVNGVDYKTFKVSYVQKCRVELNFRAFLHFANKVGLAGPIGEALRDYAAILMEAAHSRQGREQRGATEQSRKRKSAYQENCVRSKRCQVEPSFVILRLVETLRERFQQHDQARQSEMQARQSEMQVMKDIADKYASMLQSEDVL